LSIDRFFLKVAILSIDFMAVYWYKKWQPGQKRTAARNGRMPEMRGI
jgi:type II secretory pathway component PulM